MTEQLLADRVADRERMKDRIADLERIAKVEADILVLKVVVDQLVPKLGLESQFGEWMEKVRKERTRVMAELRTEMQSAFVASLDAAFKKHADEQAKTFKLYARIGAVFLIALVAKETGLIGLARTLAGIP